jgi:indole-3-glycerol phosphate synthase
MSNTVAQGRGSAMLAHIATHKREEVAKLNAVDVRRAGEAMAARRRHRSLAAAISAPPLSILAEAKRRSPSAGEFRRQFDAVDLVRRYQQAGAAASTVLADAAFFGGGPEVVAQVVAAEDIEIPVIYKDFFVDPLQVWLAASTGVSTMLAIVRILDDSTLNAVTSAAGALGLEVIYECFDAIDIERAGGCAARIIGINNRDLDDFTVDLDRARRLRESIPAGVLTVSESGIRTPDDIAAAQASGFDASLIGETILRRDDVEAAIAELKQGLVDRRDGNQAV